MIDLTKHFKIWFSKDPNEWMPLLNRLRLIRHKVINPNHTLYLVGADRCLSLGAIEEKNKFCEQYGIVYLDIDREIPKLIAAQVDENKKEIDLNLLQLANNELDAVFKIQREGVPSVGNIAVPSDVLRWLSVLMDKGIYSDLDTEIDFKGRLEIDKRFLIPCKVAWEGNLDVNNNFIAAVPDSELATEIRKAIVDVPLNADRGGEPLRWVAQLYGPHLICSVLARRYPAYCTEQSLNALSQTIAKDISVQSVNLFKNNQSHIKGAGDVSWATDSAVVHSAAILQAGKMIADVWRKKRPKRPIERVETPTDKTAEQHLDDLKALIASVVNKKIKQKAYAVYGVLTRLHQKEGNTDALRLYGEATCQLLQVKSSSDSRACPQFKAIN